MQSKLLTPTLQRDRTETGLPCHRPVMPYAWGPHRSAQAKPRGPHRSAGGPPTSPNLLTTKKISTTVTNYTCCLLALCCTTSNAAVPGLTTTSSLMPFAAAVPAASILGPPVHAAAAAACLATLRTCAADPRYVGGPHSLRAMQGLGQVGGPASWDGASCSCGSMASFHTRLYLGLCAQADGLDRR